MERLLYRNRQTERETFQLKLEAGESDNLLNYQRLNALINGDFDEVQNSGYLKQGYKIMILNPINESGKQGKSFLVWVKYVKGKTYIEVLRHSTLMAVGRNLQEAINTLSDVMQSSRWQVRHQGRISASLSSQRQFLRRVFGS